MDPDGTALRQQPVELGVGLRPLQPRVVLGAETLETVEQDQDTRFILFARLLPVLAEDVGCHCVESRCSFVQFLGQHLHQPRHPFVVVARDDGTHVRQRLEHVETTTREIQAVDVNRAGPRRDGGRDRQ